MKVRKSYIKIIIVLSLFLSQICFAKLKTTLLWTVNNLESPESAYYDKESNLIYVSNVVGEALGKDQKGYISVLNMDGSIREKYLVKGLNAPKGMRIFKGILWVSDIDTLIAINIMKKKILKKYYIKGSKFLNDVAIDKSGRVFVSDMTEGKIYSVYKKKVKLFTKTDDLPNGLLVKKNKLIMAGWGKNIKDDFSTEPLGKLYFFDLKNKKRIFITNGPVGNLDGLEELENDGGFIVSDWVKGDILHISLDGSIDKILSLSKGTADIGYITDKKILLIPLMNDNKLQAYLLE